MTLLGFNGADREKREEYEEIIDNLRCFSHHLANVPSVSIYLFLITVIFFICDLIVFPVVAVAQWPLSFI